MMPQRIRLLSIPGILFSMLSMLIVFCKQSSGQNLCVLDRASNYMIQLKNQFLVNVADVWVCRRLIGRRFDDPSVKTDVKSWPFTVIDRDGNPYIQVEYLGETKQFSPQEISSMVLTKVYTYLFPIQGQYRNILCVFVGHADEGNCRGQAWPIC